MEKHSQSWAEWLSDVAKVALGMVIAFAALAAVQVLTQWVCPTSPNF